MITFRQHIFEAEQMKDWKAYIARIPMLKAAISAMKIMKPYGDTYIVGGAVRDIITGEKDPDDIDIATNVPMDKIEELFDTFDIGKNKDFGIIVAKHGGHTFEIAQFRSDGTYSDGRRPDQVKIEMSYEKDASRRDFTINAMAVDAKGNIIDYFDGKKHIQNKVIKTVGDPEKRFGEDHLRMLRAVRFSSRLGFDIDSDTMGAIQKHSKKIKEIAPERIVKELLKMASQTGTKFADAIIKLDQSGLLKHIFPELVKMKQFKHYAEHHPEGDVWEHTIAALRQVKLKDPIVNLAVLLHDVGKIQTHSLNDEGRFTYHGHAKASMDIIDDIADRMKLDTKTRKALIFAAGNHMKLHDFADLSNTKIMKLISNDNWDVLLNVGIVDDKARKQLYDPKHWEAVKKKVEKLTLKYKNQKSQEKLRKIVNGETVMKLRKIKPGKEVGQIIQQTMAWILDNSIDPKDTRKIHKYIKEI